MQRQLVSPPNSPQTPASALDRKITRSRWTLFFERMWPRIWLPLGVIGMFLAASLLGVWQGLPAWGHATLLSAFGLALLAALVPMLRTPMPDRDAALRRIEKRSGISHRPASSYDDTLTASANDPVTKSIWAAHRDRLLALLGRMEVGGPRPRTDRLDPFAMRGLLALGLGLLFVATGERTYDRLAAPFRFGPTNEQLLARLDAWVTPPMYTGKAPIMLADGGKLAAHEGHRARILEAPQGSQLVIRAAGDGHERFRAEIHREGAAPEKLVAAGDQPPNQATPIQAAAAVPSAATELRAEIKKDVIVKVFNGSRELVSWAFSVIPDHPPKIALTKEPESTPRGAMRFSYKAEDDYGVASAEARFARVEPETTPGVDADGRAIKRRPRAPLERPPRFELRLPKSDGKIIEGKAFHDLSAHPWAGVRVKMWLEARDQAGQTGKSELLEMNLPERRFKKPLARAVVEQRRDLAVDAKGNRDHVIMALDLLTMEPQLFIPDRAVYLGLRSAHWRLTHDTSRAAARTVIDQLWHIALRIEDGNLSDAERALREAQEKLSKAIEDGAGDQELQKLMEELRQAMAQFMEALSKEAQNRGDQDQQMDENDRTVSRQDLEEMMRNIEQMARNGSRDQAQQMLSELRDLMEQLQSGKMARGQDGQGKKMMQMMDQFGDLIQKEQGLLDDTHQQQGAQEDQQGQQGENGQQGNGPRQRRRQGQQGQDGQQEQQGQQGQAGRQGQRGQRGQQGQQGQAQQGEQGNQAGNGQGPGQLRDRQGQLRDRLGQLMDDMNGMGLKPSDQLSQAQEAMRDAERALGEGDLGRAAEQEARALDQLRQGAQQMAEQMMKGMRPGRQGQAGNADPLGRPRSTTGPDMGLNVKVPDQIDAQRAREILEELRKRLSDQKRPTIELDYIERLLKRF
jgi:uncharacterized protein (TIGR02302 family)